MSTPGAQTEGVKIEMNATSANMAAHLASCGLKHRAALFESEGYTLEISLDAFTAGTLMDDLKELKLPLGERRKFFEQLKKSSTKSTRSSLYSSLCCTNILLTIVAVILFLYTAILVGVGSSIHATVGSMSSSLPSLKLPGSVVKLGTDILSADYQSLGDSAGGMAKAMDAMMPKDVHSEQAASFFNIFGDIAMYLNMIHNIIGDWQPPADAGDVDTLNSPASDWGMLSYFFGGSPVDWMRKQAEPSEINKMGKACKQFARNIAKNKLYDWSMSTNRYEDLTKCDATLCGGYRADGYCTNPDSEWVPGGYDPVTGEYIQSYYKYYSGSRCPADLINASFSTDEAWKAIYTAYNVTAWPSDSYRYNDEYAGRWYTCCANGVGPGPHEVYGKRMNKTDNPLSELGYHEKRATMTWKQWVDQFVEDMEVVCDGLIDYRAVE